MKVFCKNFIGAMCIFIAACFTGCKQEDPEPFTGIKINCDSTTVKTNSNLRLTATYYKNDQADKEIPVTYNIYTGNNLCSFEGTEDSVVFSSISGKYVMLQTNSGTGFIGIKATANGTSSSVVIVVKNSNNVLSNGDFPTGFAYGGVDMSKMTNKVTVTTPNELKSAAAVSGNLVIVKGTIDMSNGMLPAAGKKMDGANATDALNNYVKNNSSYSSYAEWIKNETKCSAGVDYNNGGIRNKYTNSIQIKPASNVAIIGEKGAVIRGGYIKIVNGVQNIVIRNLTIQDGVDPFPNHEANDGWNAQVDAIGLDNGNKIWFDHLTIEDTLHCGTAANGEKLQVYDGLLDMKEPSTKISVTHCIFRNHDKTMLIGTSDSKGDANQRFITLAYNNFHNCGQRLPMVRNTRLHVMNCLYTYNGGDYNSQSSINARKGALVWNDNNWFEGGAVPSSKDGAFVDEESIFDVAPVYPYVYLSKTEVNEQMGAGFNINY